jgi:hypothetical protein
VHQVEGRRPVAVLESAPDRWLELREEVVPEFDHRVRRRGHDEFDGVVGQVVEVPGVADDDDAVGGLRIRRRRRRRRRVHPHRLASRHPGDIDALLVDASTARATRRGHNPQVSPAPRSNE